MENKISDTIVSNNHDTQKVLATVVSTVMNFTNHFQDAINILEAVFWQERVFTKWE